MSLGLTGMCRIWQDRVGEGCCIGRMARELVLLRGTGSWVRHGWVAGLAVLRELGVEVL